MVGEIIESMICDISWCCLHRRCSPRLARSRKDVGNYKSGELHY